MLTRTGLLSVPFKPTQQTRKSKPVQLITIAKPAPYAFKPLVGLYSPYSPSCSILCNHPTDTHAKEILEKARSVWSCESKNTLQKEAEELRVSLDLLKSRNSLENVPEELFRKYTETDSRPLTPAPTLMSVHTRASGSRRCVTPDPTENKPKTKLVLDLRRSHSQETLSWYSINLQPVETPHKELTPRPKERKPKPKLIKKEPEPEPEIEPEIFETEVEIEPDEFIRRKGRNRRRKKRNPSKEPPIYQASLDPETQIATADSEFRNQGANIFVQVKQEKVENSRNFQLRRHSSLEIDSFLNVEILKQLRRELNEEVIDTEFNYKRRLALQEAFKTIKGNKVDCEELQQIKKDLQGPIIDRDFLLSLPRIFDKSSCRFELPMDSRELSKMTPLDYLRDYVIVSDSRYLLYKCIFSRHKIEQETRRISVNGLKTALSEVMGKQLKEEQIKKLQSLVNCNENTLLDFKTFCGVAALCERLFAVEFSAKPPCEKDNQCQEIEVIDFRSLDKRLIGQSPDDSLRNMLFEIKQSQGGFLANVQSLDSIRKKLKNNL